VAGQIKSHHQIAIQHLFQLDGILINNSIKFELLKNNRLDVQAEGTLNTTPAQSPSR
jgi:hypothetical protein